MGLFCYHLAPYDFRYLLYIDTSELYPFVLCHG